MGVKADGVDYVDLEWQAVQFYCAKEKGDSIIRLYHTLSGEYLLKRYKRS